VVLLEVAEVPCKVGAEARREGPVAALGSAEPVGGSGDNVPRVRGEEPLTGVVTLRVQRAVW